MCLTDGQEAATPDPALLDFTVQAGPEPEGGQDAPLYKTIASTGSLEDRPLAARLSYARPGSSCRRCRPAGADGAEDQPRGMDGPPVADRQQRADQQRSLGTGPQGTGGFFAQRVTAGRGETFPLDAAMAFDQPPVRPRQRRPVPTPLLLPTRPRRDSSDGNGNQPAGPVQRERGPYPIARWTRRCAPGWG